MQPKSLIRKNIVGILNLLIIFKCKKTFDINDFKICVNFERDL